MADLEDFKQQFPTMYEKFLAMNKALAGLLREKRRNGGETESQRHAEFEGDLPDMLELD